MNLNDVNQGIHKHKKPRRLGRGLGSGQGKTAGRGHKGQKSRSGYSSKSGFEGGQMPLQRRLPKRGFTNIFKTEYNIVNVGQLAIFSPGSEVTPEELLRAGLINTTEHPTKILGFGDIKHPLLVGADKFSSSAEKKIVAAGGSIKQA